MNNYKILPPGQSFIDSMGLSHFQSNIIGTNIQWTGFLCRHYSELSDAERASDKSKTRLPSVLSECFQRP